MAGFGGDSWLSEFSSCEQQAQEILEKIHERNKQQRSGANYSKLNSAIRVQMKKFSRDLVTLRQGLSKASSAYHITQREMQRRQDMLDNLSAKERQIEDAFRNDRPEASEGRSNLFGNQGSAGFHDDPWATEESEETRGLGVSDIRQQQTRVMDEQDQGLDVLSTIIARQKQLGQAIGDEVDLQNELIDDIQGGVQKTDARLLKETRHVKIVDKKSANCGGRNSDGGMIVVIVLLLIAIVVVACIPK
ncbi:syntaxin-8-like isoform X4 [Branchiostoma lanceolatum]|uniref:syntaxin-8-like isoform X4 n=1 Tax=Branchiostoma lanceolatum TaxID=7740 RepID=UPI003451BDAF